MTLCLLLAVLAQASTAAAPNTTPPTPVPQQLFIAPSGEPFQAPFDAPYPSAAWFARADADHDGKLMAIEFVADFMRYIERLDTDRNGQVETPELEAYDAALTPEVLTGSGNGGGYRRDNWIADEGGDENKTYRPIGSSGAWSGSARGTARFEFFHFTHPLSSMDVNFNGRITRDEATYAADQRFDALDTDRRGYLMLTGLPETDAQQRGGGDRGRRRSRDR